MWASTVPGAITYMVSLLSSGQLGSTVSVTDGPVVTSNTYREVVTVGYAGAEDDLSVEVTTSPEGWATSPDREQYAIRCAASVLRGDSGGMGLARTRAYELFGQIGGLISEDSTLGGLVMRAYLTDVSLRQSQTQAGAVATVSFSISIDAFTQGA